MKNIILSETQDTLIKDILTEMLNPNLNGGYKVNAEVTKSDGKLPTTSEIPQLVNSMDKAQETTGLDTTAKVNIGNDNDTETLKLSSNNPNKMQTKESFLITKKQLNEARLRKLKSNTKVIKLKHFVK